MTLEAVTLQPLDGRVPDGVVRVPGSKSYTNRALLIAALARGKSTLTGALFSDDTRYMSEALRTLGVSVTAEENAARFEVTGADGTLVDANVDLFVGNAGTAARFITASAALGRGSYRIDGVPRMRERPMQDLLSSLRTLGVSVTEHGASGCLPVTISGRTRREKDATLKLPGNASSQFISGLLMVCPYFEGRVTLEVEGDLVSKPYLDMTCAVMQDFGVNVERDDYRRFWAEPGQRYRGRDYAVEPDASAASYFFAAAAMTGGRVVVEGLGTDTRQGDYGLVDILERMGARVQREPRRTTVIGTGKLQGVEVDMQNLSDVAQTLAVVATGATSPTRITGIGFIRKKETDRIGHVVRELQALGIDAREEPDGYVVHPGNPNPGRVETYDDHRMAMSFALLGLLHTGITIADPGCTSKTFPNYFDVLAQYCGATNTGIVGEP